MVLYKQNKRLSSFDYFSELVQIFVDPAPEPFLRKENVLLLWGGGGGGLTTVTYIYE